MNSCIAKDVVLLAAQCICILILVYLFAFCLLNALFHFEESYNVKQLNKPYGLL